MMDVWKWHLKRSILKLPPLINAFWLFDEREKKWNCKWLLLGDSTLPLVLWLHVSVHSEYEWDSSMVPAEASIQKLTSISSTFMVQVSF